MRWRRAMRKGGKWAGLFSCAVIVAAYVASVSWYVGLNLTRGLGVGVARGALRVGWAGPAPFVGNPAPPMFQAWRQTHEWEAFCWRPFVFMDRQLRVIG